MERVDSEYNHIIALRSFPKELEDSPPQIPLRIQLPKHRVSSPTPLGDHLNFSTTHVLHFPESIQAPGIAEPRRKLVVPPIVVEKSHAVSPSMSPHC